jgi:hypothetical protein
MQLLQAKVQPSLLLLHRGLLQVLLQLFSFISYALHARWQWYICSNDGTQLMM